LQKLLNTLCFHELTAGIVDNPPCDIAKRVIFVDGICPISRCTECSECITNDFDALCVWSLTNDPETFGQA